jgi:two-component system chemotaxis response regulator CheY
MKMSIRMLLVDDMVTMRKVVRQKLLAAGADLVVEAGSAEEAWKLMDSNSYDFNLIVSDWNMPNGSGFDLLKRVRADSRFDRVRFFMLTAEGEAQTMEDAKKQGCDDYLLKPFDAADLIDRVRALLSK